MKLDARLFPRLLLYFAGQMCVAFGVAFSIKSDLGISPISSLSFAVYNVLLYHGVTTISLGACVTLSHLCFMLIQAAILRGAYKVANLLQVLVSAVFGRFVDFSVAVVGPDFSMSYVARLGWLAVSIALIAVGVSFYVGVDIMPMPGDGLSVAVSRKLKEYPFHKMKRVVDCMLVTSAALVSLVGMGRVVGVREGTVLTALLIGPAVGLMKPWVEPILRRVRPSGAATG